MATVEEVLDARGKTHGRFEDHAWMAQELKGQMRGGVRWPSLTPAQQEALEMVASKIGRILAGDPNEPDHWRDIAGYAILVARGLEDCELRARSVALDDMPF